MDLLAIKSNRVVTPAGIQKAVVIVKHRKIEALVNEVPTGDFHVIDIADKVLMPGIIDTHVHINEPGTDWEGFDTATKSAIAGGITTLVDMPLNSLPVTTTATAFDEKVRAATGKSTSGSSKLHCYCGLWGGIIPGNEKEIDDLVQKGVLGFKAFLTHSGINEFPNVTEKVLRTAMPIIAKYNLPVLVHGELQRDVPDTKPVSRNYADYLHSRPKQWENDAIELMIRLCEEFNCRTHIVHLSSAGSIERIVKAKSKGLPLTVETAQHYLYFSAEQIQEGRTEFKCAPPIRDKANNDQLWQALKNGVIDFVATDHSPSLPAMKDPASGDFMKAWGGIASLQLALPVLWTAARQHGGQIPDMANWLCEKPALLAGIEKAKGKIEKGFDADLVAWDPDKTFIVTKNKIHHRHKLTPYLGQELYGVVEQTWLAGKKVFDNDNFVLNKGSILLPK